MKKIIILNIILFGLIFGDNLLFATILEKLDTKKLTEKSNFIIIGKIDEILYEFDEQMNMIFTIINISNEQIIKGDNKIKNIKLLLPGGMINGKQMHVDGIPEFKSGEKVLLFLEPEIKNSYRVTGWYQGKFTVEGNIIKEKNILLEKFIQEIENFIH